MYKIKKIYKCKDGRVRVRIITDENQSKVISYPKILMEKKLGRPLEPYEEVHHIDGDFTNNDISNLEIVNHGEHQRHHSQKYYDKLMICPICGKEFLWTAKKQRSFYNNINRKKQRNHNISKQPFCSSHCSGLYGKREQDRRDSIAECELNGEPFPNGNTVPNKINK